MAAVWRSFAHANGTLGADVVVNRPSGTADGDLLFAYCIATAGHVVTPPGAGVWVPLASSVGTNAAIWVKVASSEPATYTFDVAGAGNTQVVIVRVTGQHPSTPIDVSSGVSSTGNLVIPSVTPTGADRLLLQMVAKNGSTTFTGPGSQAERYDDNTAFTCAGGDEIVGAGATGTRTWTPAAGTTPGVGFMVAITPAPPTTGGFTGGYDFSGTFAGAEGPAEGSFAGDYDFSGSFNGEAPGVASGGFTGGYDFSGTFAGVAPPPTPGGNNRWTPGGRNRFTARRTPANRRRSR